jgi:hypothetical protein
VLPAKDHSTVVRLELLPDTTAGDRLVNGVLTGLLLVIVTMIGVWRRRAAGRSSGQ